MAFNSFLGDFSLLYTNEITILTVLGDIIIVILGQIFIFLVERDLRIVNKPIIRITPISMGYGFFFISFVIIFFVIDKLAGYMLGLLFIGYAIVWIYVGVKYLHFLR